MQMLTDLIEEIHAAFPPGEMPREALSFNEVCKIFARDPAFRPVAAWTEITSEDLNQGNLGSLILMMSEPTFVAWAPAWLTNVAVYKMEVREAVIGFVGACSPKVAEAVGRLDRLKERVNRLNAKQRLAVAHVGDCLAGESDVVAFFEEDVGRGIADAWARYAREGFPA